MRLLRSVGLPLLALLACDVQRGAPGPQDTSVSTPEEQQPLRGRGRDGDLGVMSRNLYLGADLGPVIAATSPQEFIAATSAVWAMVLRNDFRTRAEAIADEIARARPELVGLQEAYLWEAFTGAGAPVDRIDYVALLLGALEERGLEYRVAAEVELFQFQAPVLVPGSAAPILVRETDHGVVLARADVETSNPQGVVFGTLLPVTVLGQQVPVKRGWASVDARHGDATVRFVTTHLEAFHPGVRAAQAGELAAALAGVRGPVVLVGDLNSQPGTEGEAVLAAAGFEDAWAKLHPGARGLTCCFLEDLTLPDRLETRIDYVLARGAIEPHRIAVVGDRPGDRIDGLWPSDHAGVRADLRLARGRGHRGGDR